MARLLIAYDGSDQSRLAIRAAADLFPGADAVLLYVAEPPMPIAAVGVAGVPLSGPGVPPPPGGGVETERLEQIARGVADEGLREASDAGLNAAPEIAWGAGSSGVGEVICEAAENHDVAAVIVGSRGHSGLRAALLGSVSNAVLHHCRRPVIVAPRGE